MLTRTTCTICSEVETAHLVLIFIIDFFTSRELGGREEQFALFVYALTFVLSTFVFIDFYFY